MLHQKPSLAKWQQTSVIAKTPALFIDVGERNALLQISIMDKLSSLQRALLSFIFSGRNSIMFLGLVRCPRLLENNALILYADPIFTVHFPVVRGETKSSDIFRQRQYEQNPAPWWLFFWVFLIFHVSEGLYVLCCWYSFKTRGEVFNVVWTKWFWAGWPETCLSPGARGWPRASWRL